MDKFDEWLGDCSRDRVKENISNDASLEREQKKINIREIIDRKILLVDDLETKQEIMNAVRKRVM